MTLLGMLAKENTAVMAGLIPLSALLQRRRLALQPAAAATPAVPLYLVLQALLLTGVPPGTHRAALVDNPLSTVAAPVRVLNAVRLLGLYAFRTVFPLHLSADHSYNELPVLPLGSPVLWLGAGAAVLSFALPALLLRRRAPAAALGFLVFPLAFAVPCNVLLPIGTIFAERLAYLPSVGYAIALGALLERWGSRGPGARRAALVAASALVLVYGARAAARNRVWDDVVRFDLQLARDSP